MVCCRYRGILPRIPYPHELRKEVTEDATKKLIERGFMQNTLTPEEPFHELGK